MLHMLHMLQPTCYRINLPRATDMLHMLQAYFYKKRLENVLLLKNKLVTCVTCPLPSLIDSVTCWL